MKHKELFELLEAYALGVLEGAEQEAVRMHLSECDACRDELARWEQVVGHLGFGVKVQAPPAELKARILLKARASVTQKPAASSLPIKWVTALALAASLVLAYNLYQVRQENESLKERLAEAQDVSEILASPGMQFVALKGIEPNLQAFGKVVVDSHRGSALVYMYELPPMPEGMEYQLWVIREGKPSSAGVFRVNADGSALMELQDLADAETIAAFAVTIEPEGGLPAPTGMMYLQGP